MLAFVSALLDENGERRNLRVRESPGGTTIGLLEPTNQFIITGEAVCGDDGLRWWPIQTIGGDLNGWSVEGFAPNDYLMFPTDSQEDQYSEEGLINPEGQHSQIAFGTLHGIFLVNPDGTGLTAITGENLLRSNYDYDPAWSPDGQQIVFTAYRDGLALITIMDSDGSNQIHLQNGTDYSYFPTWSPDGSRIAFTSDALGSWDIFYVGINDQLPYDLTGPSDTTELVANWSPDGESLIYASNPDGNFDLFVMNLTDFDATQITTTQQDEISADWSPDSTKIAFSAGDADNTLALYVMNADGSDPVQITFPDDNVLDLSASWSPDSEWLAFCREFDDNTRAIYTVRADGSELREVVGSDSGILDACILSWSPWLAGSAPMSTYVPATLTPIDQVISTEDCSGSPPSQLLQEDAALINPEPLANGEERVLSIHDTPGGPVVDTVPPIVLIIIMGNSVCGEDGLRWWPIGTTHGYLGWAIEGYAPYDYWLLPYE